MPTYLQSGAKEKERTEAIDNVESGRSSNGDLAATEIHGTKESREPEKANVMKEESQL